VRLVFTRMSFREVQTGITGKCRTVWIVSCGAASWRCSDPVIVYWLIGMEDCRDPLSSINIYILNFDWIMFNAIGLHESNVMVVNRKGKERPTS